MERQEGGKDEKQKERREGRKERQNGIKAAYSHDLPAALENKPKSLRSGWLPLANLLMDWLGWLEGGWGGGWL